MCAKVGLGPAPEVEETVKAVCDASQLTALEANLVRQVIKSRKGEHEKAKASAGAYLLKYEVPNTDIHPVLDKEILKILA